MDTNTGTAPAENKSFTRFFPHIARILMGLAFLAFGVMGLLHLGKPPADLPEVVKTVNAALMTAGYMDVASTVMTLVGALLLINRFVPLALALIAPILVGILTYHIAIYPSTIGMGVFFTLLELYLAWSYRSAFRPMLAGRVRPG